MITVVVTGGRKFFKESRVNRVLNAVQLGFGIRLLVQGGAPGADALAQHWAERNAVQTLTVEAEWNRYGGHAGGVRNQRMLDLFKPDLVVAFPGNQGTRDMIRRTKEGGFPLLMAYDNEAIRLCSQGVK